MRLYIPMKKNNIKGIFSLQKYGIVYCKARSKGVFIWITI